MDIQLDKLEELLNQMNKFLDEILLTDCGINDIIWRSALKKIDNGIAEALQYIARTKRFQWRKSKLSNT